MEYFVARQPIFDRKLNVFAYELLFRSSLSQVMNQLDGDKATSDVITTSFMLIGLEELTSGKKAFVNFTRNLLISNIATLFPKELMLVEVLETVKPDNEVIAACKKLKQAGYTIILDDFTVGDVCNPLIEVADIIKVDFQNNPVEGRELIPRVIDLKHIRFLAEKIETEEDMNHALEFNYTYFQGYYFSKPVIHSGKSIPVNKLTYLRMLKEINRPDVDLNDIRTLIEQDISLSYKLFRFINSAYFGFHHKIKSIQHAISLLGVNEMKKWISLISLNGLVDDNKSQELIVNSLLRAKFCEELAMRIGLKERRAEFFLMGLFSFIDVIIQRPMAELLSKLPLIEEIKTALLNGNNIFRDVFNVILAYEKGNWDAFLVTTKKINIDAGEIATIYLYSLKWTNQIIQHKPLSL